MFNTNIRTRPSHPRSRVLAAGSANASDRTGYAAPRSRTCPRSSGPPPSSPAPVFQWSRLSGSQPENTGTRPSVTIPVGGTRSSRLPRRSSSPAARLLSAPRTGWSRAPRPRLPRAGLSGSQPENTGTRPSATIPVGGTRSSRLPRALVVARSASSLCSRARALPVRHALVFQGSGSPAFNRKTRVRFPSRVLRSVLGSSFAS